MSESRSQNVCRSERASNKRCRDKAIKGDGRFKDYIEYEIVTIEDCSVVIKMSLASWILFVINLSNTLKGHQPLSIIKMAVEAKVKACRVELLAQR
jgi:hypothetical protein